MTAPLALLARWMPRLERYAARSDTERKQASDGELGAERARSDEPSSARCAARAGRAGRTRCRQGAAAGHPAAGRTAAGRPTATGAASRGCGRSAGMRAFGGARHGRGAEPPWQEHRRKRRSKAAQRDDVGAAGGALAAVHERQPVALSVGVEDAVGERAHQRALLLAPVAVADRLHERADLAGHPGAPGAAALHQLAHPRLADAHPLSRLRARQALQVAERGRLALAPIQTSAQRLEQLAQAHAVVQLVGEVSLGAAAHRLRLGPDDQVRSACAVQR